MRWTGDALRDARANLQGFQAHHEDIVAILRPYFADPGCVDLSGKFHNPDYALSSWLWACSNHPDNHWIWDFCEHYQRCHLRRGLLFYCEQILRSWECWRELKQEELPLWRAAA